MVSKNYNHNKIYWSIFFTLWAIILAYSYVQEPHIERFEGIFVGYIELYLNNHILLDNHIPMPLFETGIPVDQSLPLRIQGIVESETNWPGFVSLFLMIKYISGLSPQLLVILPLGFIFISLIYISIVRTFHFSKNGEYIPYLAIILFSFYLITTRFYSSFYVAPPAIMLFLVIILCSKKYMEGSNCGRRYILIFTLCALSLSHYWQTPTMWTLYFVILIFMITCAFYILSRIFKGRVILPDSESVLRRSIYLLIITTVMILTFCHLWQSEYLNLFINSPDVDLVSLLTQKLFAKNPFPVPYAYNYKDLMFGQIYYVAYLLTLVLSSIMIAVPLLFLLFRSKAERQLHVPLSVAFALSVIATQIMVTVTYFRSNSLGFPLVPLLLPLLSVWLFSDLDRQYRILNRSNFNIFLHSMLITLIILNVICALCLPLTNQAGANSETKYNDVGECFNWLHHNTLRDKDLIVDFNILGLFLQHEAKTSELSLSYVDLSPEIYSILVDDTYYVPPRLKESYAVIDHATMIKGLPIHTTSARAMLVPEWGRISDHMNLDKLYADSHLSIFKVN